jgi:C4-dicarboxylate-specific signal transduction histidine kinase
VSRLNRILSFKPSRIWSYGFAVFSVTSALIITRWVTPHVGFSGTLFLAVVMLSAWFGGVGPGLLATVLSSLAFHYYFTHPIYALGPRPSREMPRLLMYIVSNLLIALLSAAQRNAKESLRLARDDLKRTVEDLQKTNEALYVESRERKRTEEALRQAQADLARANRVSCMGELTASIAHEVKQPIAAAITDANTCVRWLSRDQPDLEEARAAASRIVQDGRRASEIVNRIRLLFKKDTPQRELVDLNEVIQEMMLLLHSEATQFAVLVRTELAADVPPVMGDRVQLQQVLMNLMTNSIDAMKMWMGRASSPSSRSEARMVRC